MFNINELYANRIGGKNFLNNTNIYSLEKLKRNSDDSLNENKLLDFGVGISDRMTDVSIIDTLFKEAKKWENRGYVINDCKEFNKACSGYIRVEHNANIDYRNEIMQVEGIREALNLLPLAFLNKDDYLITTSPSYEVIKKMGKWLDCKVYEYPLNRFNGYLIDFEDIDEEILKKCKLLYLNYPNNPTGTIANKEFFKEVIKYAKKYNFIVINDATYADIVFDEKDKVSFLSVEGAKDVGVELYSFSYGFNMSGWRIGFIAGNKDIIKACETIKENWSFGKFLPMQKAAIVAINNHEKIVEPLKKIYLRRHKLIKEVLVKHGFTTEVPKAGIYQYVSLPKSCNGVSFETAQEFAYWLKENDNILVIPYDNQGGYIRLAMTFIANDEEEEKEIINELDSRLSKYKFEFK